jgi:hypothetical protein
VRFRRLGPCTTQCTPSQQLTQIPIHNTHTHTRRIYHFNYLAQFGNGTGGASVQGQQSNGSAWSATFSQPLWAWDDGQANSPRFIAWSTEIVMTAGDKFRVVNSPAGLNETFEFQQLSGYFVGAAPLGAEVTSSYKDIVVGKSMFTAPSNISYDNVGGCSAAGVSSAGYTAPRSGLYQLQVRANDTING